MSDARNMKYPPAVKTPCNECPWRRNSAPGHLGPHGPQEWLSAVHGEAAIACHMTISKESWDDPGMRQCAGAAIYRENVHKLPINPTIAVADEPDYERVFGRDREFLDHHTMHWAHHFDDAPLCWTNEQIEEGGEFPMRTRRESRVTCFACLQHLADEADDGQV